MNYLRIVRSLFVFSRKEANGFLIVILLVVLYLTLPYFFKKYFGPDIHSDKDRLILQAWIKEQEQKEPEPIHAHKPASASVYFNPNTATNEDLIKAGIPEWLSKRIINYRNKVAPFNHNRDLLKVYGFSEKLYDKVSPFIVIKEIGGETKVVNEDKLVLKDLNSITAEELQKIKGIGPVLSERIIKFRDKLGGFVSKDQIKEVYGLDSNVTHDISSVVFIAEDYVPQKININSADEKSLAAHPYIKSYKAKGILFKRVKTRIAGVDQLKELKIFNEEELRKVAPYLAY